MSKLTNIGAERALLAGLFQFGQDVFLDISDITNSDCFSNESNQIIFTCIKHVLLSQDKIDLPSLMTGAFQLGFQNFFDNKAEIEYIRSLNNFPIHKENVASHAKKLRKLQIARQAQCKAKEAFENLNKVTGDEKIEEILAIAENPILKLSLELSSSRESSPELISDNIDAYIQFLEDNPCEMRGLSTGFPKLDYAIGGGLRKKTVNLFAARPGVGKSSAAINVGLHTSNICNIPTLILDTEMSYDDQVDRMIANLGNTKIKIVESGKFSKNEILKNKVNIARDKIKTIPLYYISIAGKTFETIISVIKRWIIQNVGFDERGRTNNCLVLYDYFKLMDKSDITRDIAEHQAIGFQLSELHNLCVEYDFPCLGFVQLNRDGIDNDSLASISQSDRIGWLATSISFLKRKTDDEIAEDGIENGNMKLVVLKSRHGAGLMNNDYINISFNADCAKMTELKLKSEILTERKNNKF